MTSISARLHPPRSISDLRQAHNSCVSLLVDLQNYHLKYCDQKAERNHSSTVQHRIAIIKQLISWQIAAITERCGQMSWWGAKGSAVRCGWHWGAGA